MWTTGSPSLYHHANSAHLWEVLSRCTYIEWNLERVLKFGELRGCPLESSSAIQMYCINIISLVTSRRYLKKLCLNCVSWASQNSLPIILLCHSLQYIFIWVMTWTPSRIQCSVDGEKPSMCPSVWWCGCCVCFPSLLVYPTLSLPFYLFLLLLSREIGEILTEWNVLVYGLKKNKSVCFCLSLSLSLCLSNQYYYGVKKSWL